MIAQLVDLLARLVTDGELTEEQAASILAYWRGRPEAELARVLPLAVTEGVGALDDDDAPPFFPIILLYGGMNHTERVRRMNVLQDAHAAQMRRLTEDLEAGRLTVAQWQAATRQANAQLLDAAASLGSRRLTVRARQAIAETEREQAAYLQRFADGVSVRRLAAPLADVGGAAPLALWTAAYIAQRATSYSGAARGAFFASVETDAEAGNMGAGWVVQYLAVHDGMTCSACGDAEGYYLPGDGPMPGEVCYGGGACRCVRVPVYDPARWSGLMGVGVKA